MNATVIQHFSARLLKLRDQVRGDIQASIDAVAEEVHPVGEDTKEPIEGLDKELVLEHNEEDIYHAVNAALQRIEQGSFGRCTGCGKPIPKARLDAMPYAEYCVACERQIETAG
jgi:RNA polymerase-binding protein DksA